MRRNELGRSVWSGISRAKARGTRHRPGAKQSKKPSRHRRTAKTRLYLRPGSLGSESPSTEKATLKDAPRTDRAAAIMLGASNELAAACSSFMPCSRARISDLRVTSWRATGKEKGRADESALSREHGAQPSCHPDAVDYSARQCPTMSMTDWRVGHADPLVAIIGGDLKVSTLERCRAAIGEKFFGMV